MHPGNSADEFLKALSLVPSLDFALKPHPPVASGHFDALSSVRL